MAGSGAGTTGLSVPCVGPPDAAQDDSVDDNALVLPSHELQQVNDFRNQLSNQTTDDDKLRLCAEKCNKLLGDHTKLEMLMGVYDDVMSAACCGYANKRQEKARTKTLPAGHKKKTTDNNDEWERYFGVAINAARVKSSCLVALKAVAVRWGREVVVHYQWASRGEHFCNLLRTAASAVPKRGDAARALTAIMYERHANLKRRCPIACSRDPITPSDLRELKVFPLSEIRESVLPAGFGLDEFGIMAHEQFAVPRHGADLAAEPSDSASDSELSDAPGTDCTELSELAESPETTSPDPPPSMSLRERAQLSYKEAPVRGSGTTRSLPVRAPKAPPCCPVPPAVLGALDDDATTFNPADFSAIRGQLCHRHTQRLLDQVWVEHPPIGPPTLRRAASLSDITQPPKRLRLEDSSPSASVSAHGTAPSHDQEVDEAYRELVLAELQHTTHTLPADSHGKRTADLVLALLGNTTPPNTDSSRGPVDALFCAGDEAADLVESLSPNSLPIITQGQQQFRWREDDRPVVQLFHRMTHLGRATSVQVPSRSSTQDSFEERTLDEARQRFLAEEDTASPWNLLDLHSPLPSSILPSFLTGENSGLLLHVRDAVLMEHRAERVAAPRQKWNRWKNILEWVLLSEGGHQTAPHMDSNGLSTWITVQEGCMGFGWMASPTEAEEAEWVTSGAYTGGRWRYIVLKPGQTVFFRSGTIHFVFRARAPQTLALGGHLLQWSGIERWMRIVRAQMANPRSTNEDMEQTAPMYVDAISRLVKARSAEGRAEELGGDAAVERFLADVKEFNKLYARRKKKRAR